MWHGCASRIDRSNWKQSRETEDDREERKKKKENWTKEKWKVFRETDREISGCARLDGIHGDYLYNSWQRRFGGPSASLLGQQDRSFPPAEMIHGLAVDKAPTRRFARKTSHGQFILNITARFAGYDLFWALKGRLPPQCTTLPPKTRL